MLRLLARGNDKALQDVHEQRDLGQADGAWCVYIWTQSACMCITVTVYLQRVDLAPRLSANACHDTSNPEPIQCPYGLITCPHPPFHPHPLLRPLPCHAMPSMQRTLPTSPRPSPSNTPSLSDSARPRPPLAPSRDTPPSGSQRARTLPASSLARCIPRADRLRRVSGSDARDAGR